jgi:selenocysteine-specific elongation factor
MKVIATAGHVDHGKSTLISVLTGINPDRLKEEKTREMTIDLGFAWLDLPSGETVGIIDVPGHRDFIENMLAGVGGIDAVIFVIAADEGIMPQTREHLAILDLLAVKFGVIALTKSDLVNDADWLDMVKNDIQNEVKNTFLENAPIIPVSAKTKAGLGDLLNTLETVLKQVPPRVDQDRPRLSVDRVFIITGFGTVVTGTLNDGKFATGNEIQILPSGIKGRIRGLQTHKQKADEVLPGSRAAINIAGIEITDIKRGDLVTTSSFYRPSQRLDALIKILPISTRAIKHNVEIKIYHLAAERVGRVRVLGKDEILPGEEGYVQIEFTEPIVAVRNDRFILRIPSPGETVGGGVIIQAEAVRRYKRFSPDVLEKLAALHAGTNEDRILDTVQNHLICPVLKIAGDLSLSLEDVNKSVNRLISQGDLIDLSGTESAEKLQMIITRNNWQLLVQKTVDILQAHHAKYPLRSGLTREELKSKLKLENKTFGIVYKAILCKKNIIESNGFIHTPTHTVTFTAEQNTKVKLLHDEIEKVPFSPPGLNIIYGLLGEELLNALIEKQDLFRVSNEVAFRKNEYVLMKEYVLAKITTDGKLSVSEFRDYFNTSRKYALAFLEHLDAIGFTIRDGDYRKLGNINK